MIRGQSGTTVGERLESRRTPQLSGSRSTDRVDGARGGCMTSSGQPESDEYPGLRPLARLSGAGQHANRLARSLHSGPIAALLRQAIIDGELPAGTPLVELRLAERLAVSRGPIRNALVLLQ